MASGTPVAAAALDTRCHCNVSGGIYDTSTSGVTGASTATGCSSTLTVEAINCTIHVPAMTKTGTTTNNITQTGAFTTAATAWGMRITGVTFTTTAPASAFLILSTARAPFLGTVAVRALTASL